MADMPAAIGSFSVDPASGGFRAHAWGSNGKLVWWTEVYTTKTNALHAIAIMKAGAKDAPVYDRT